MSGVQGMKPRSRLGHQIVDQSHIVQLRCGMDPSLLPDLYKQHLARALPYAGPSIPTHTLRFCCIGPSGKSMVVQVAQTDNPGERARILATDDGRIGPCLKVIPL